MGSGTPSLTSTKGNDMASRDELPDTCPACGIDLVHHGNPTMHLYSHMETQTCELCGQGIRFIRTHYRRAHNVGEAHPMVRRTQARMSATHPWFNRRWEEPA